MHVVRSFLGAVLGLGVLALPASAQIFDNVCDVTRDINQRVAVPIGTRLNVDAAQGSLVVRGVQGLREARITGRACASTAALLEEVSVAVRRDGNGVTIETQFPDRNWRNEFAKIDLVLEVPADVPVHVEDGSGEAEISGVAELSIDDGSGDLRISDVRGDVFIDDGSGGIDVRGVGGDVRVDDGSGGIDIADVRGSVRIDDGSGSIDVRDVRGDFTVVNDGSGGIDWANVHGRVSVPNRRGRGR